MNIINAFFSRKIKIKEENNLIIISIQKNMNINELYKILTLSKHSKLINTLSKETLIKENNIIKEQKIIIKKTNVISKTKQIVKITQLNENNYNIKNQITINITDMTYKSNFESPNKPCILQEIIENISSIKNIQEYVNINEIYNILNIVPKKNYFPVIKSNRLTFSWANRFGSTDIYSKIRATLDIILNETSEKVGEITFNYMSSPNITYTGNVSYKIKDEFQNKGYATEALNLLKQLLKKHQHQEKDLYISVDIENTKSQKVAINNEGKLYYEGPVPKNEPLTKRNGITKIKMYHIKID